MSDRDAIVETMCRYGRAIDSRDFELLATAISDDAVIRYSSSFGDELNGIVELKAYVANAIAGLDATQHLFGNFEVEIEGDGARIRCYVHAQHLRAGGRLFTVGGRYDNTAVRSEDGYWRISRLDFHPIWTGGDPEVLDHVMKGSNP